MCIVFILVSCYNSVILLFFRVGLVESKIRHLVGNLERNPFVKLAHVSTESFGALNERYVQIHKYFQ